jgi:hypothetical protein
MFAGMNCDGSRQYIAVRPPHAAAEIGSRLTGRYVKVKFTPEEDARLLELVREYGPKEWITVASLMQTRNPRQCRERYNNYMDPNLRHDGWTAEEDALLDEKYREIGPKWNSIGKAFANRSDNALRNRWMMMNRRQTRGDSPDYRSPETPKKINESEPVAQSHVPDVLPIPAEPAIAKTEGIFGIMDFLRPGMALEKETFDPWSGF